MTRKRPPVTEGLFLQSACRPGSVVPFTERATIHLGPESPQASSNLPGAVEAGSSVSPVGLAPSGVCLAAAVSCSAGALLPHRFTLAGDESPAVCSLLHFPPVARPGNYPALCPVEPGPSSATDPKQLRRASLAGCRGRPANCTYKFSRLRSPLSAIPRPRRAAGAGHRCGPSGSSSPGGR